MIQQETFLHIVDNSGIKKVKCIKIFGGSDKRYGLAGNVIKASVQDVRRGSLRKVEYRKGDLVLCLIVYTKSILRRKNGQSFKFSRNGAVIIDKNKKPLATRFLSPILREFRLKKHLKIISLAPTIL